MDGIDHELVRRGLHAILDADLTLDVMGEISQFNLRAGPRRIPH